MTAAFSFSGTELVGLAAAETHNPSKSLPKAIKQVFWRIAIVGPSYLTQARVAGTNLQQVLHCFDSYHWAVDPI